MVMHIYIIGAYMQRKYPQQLDLNDLYGSLPNSVYSVITSFLALLRAKE